MRIVGSSPGMFQLVAVLCSISLAAQDTGALQARQLYYKSKSAPETESPQPVNPKPDQAAKSTPSTRPRPKTSPAAKPLGLKYTIEQEDASGNSFQVDPDKTFSTGDVIRLRMEVNTDAYVYLLSRGASGNASFLFPQSGEDNRLKAYQSVQVPAAPGDPIRFDQPAGTETLYILVSRSPVPEFEGLLRGRGAGQQIALNVPSSQFGELVASAERLQSRDLVRGKTNAAAEHAVYAVNVSSTPGAQVLQKLELKHR